MANTTLLSALAVVALAWMAVFGSARLLDWLTTHYRREWLWRLAWIAVGFFVLAGYAIRKLN